MASGRGEWVLAAGPAGVCCWISVYDRPAEEDGGGEDGESRRLQKMRGQGEGGIDEFEFAGSRLAHVGFAIRRVCTCCGGRKRCGAFRLPEKQIASRDFGV